MSLFSEQAKSILFTFRTLYKDELSHDPQYKNNDLGHMGLSKHDILAMNDIACFHKLDHMISILDNIQKVMRPRGPLADKICDLMMQTHHLYHDHFFYDQRIIHGRQHSAKCLLNLIQLLRRPKLSKQALDEVSKNCEALKRFGQPEQIKKAQYLLKLHKNIHPLSQSAAVLLKQNSHTPIQH